MTIIGLWNQAIVTKCDNIVVIYICEQACENQPCEYKLHHANIFSSECIVFHFCKLQKSSKKFVAII